jgi:hypothetical protein
MIFLKIIIFLRINIIKISLFKLKYIYLKLIILFKISLYYLKFKIIDFYKLIFKIKYSGGDKILNK